MRDVQKTNAGERAHKEDNIEPTMIKVELEVTKYFGNDQPADRRDTIKVCELFMSV